MKKCFTILQSLALAKKKSGTFIAAACCSAEVSAQSVSESAHMNWCEGNLMYLGNEECPLIPPRWIASSSQSPLPALLLFLHACELRPHICYYIWGKSMPGHDLSNFLSNISSEAYIYIWQWLGVTDHLRRGKNQWARKVNFYIDWWNKGYDASNKHTGDT